MPITNHPLFINEILNKLTKEGFEAYVVGGSVRDMVRGCTPSDWDIATSASPAAVARLFPKTVLTGEKFGAVTVVLSECSVEVTTFRADGEYRDGRHPENVEYVSDIVTDLSRRDYTVNAMAQSIDGEIVDPFGGKRDIEAGIIRCVGNPGKRFAEDALRMLRTFRFSAQLGYEIESNTLQAIYANARSAANISAERINTELEKTLLSQRPQIVGDMIKVGLLDRFLCRHGEKPKGLERLNELAPESVVRWYAFNTALCDGEYIKSSEEFLCDMRLDGKRIKVITSACKISEITADRVGIKRLLAKNGAQAVRCAAAVSDLENNADTLSYVDEIIASGECISLDKLAVTGRDIIALGLSPGREIGELLEKLLCHVIENPEDNNRGILMNLVKSYKA